MSARPPVSRPPGAGDERLPGLTACSLCSGETLGAADRLSGGQLGRLRRLGADGVARVTFSECLDECERGDVVVARASRAARGAAARPVWFARLAGDEATRELELWLREGGPGAADLPRTLVALRIDRTDSGTASHPG